MIAGLKPYPEMKDSGVKWLGAVPAQWEVHRLRSVADMRVSNVDKHTREGEQPVRLCNYVDVYNNDQIQSGMNFMPATATGEEIERFRLRSGDVLITKDSEAWNDIGVPALVREVEDDVVSGYHLALLRSRTNRIHGDYLFRAIQSVPVAYQFHIRANGVTRYGLSHEAIKSTRIPVPSTAEQATIARFLDQAERRIQRHIRVKQKLIALLEEQKQAIVHQAVTGKIDVLTGKPYPSYKDSNIEWLGAVPQHWEVAALRHRYSQCLGKMLDTKRITGKHLLPYLRNVDVQWNRINITDLPTMDIPLIEYERYTVRRGDLLVCEGGDVGRSALWVGELPACGFQKALHRLRPRKASRDVPRFIYYALRDAARSNAFNDGHVSTIAHLTGDKLRAHRFPFPPRTDQGALVRFLDRASNKIDQTILHVRRQIDLVRDYRSRLIADVVTGKLCVGKAGIAQSEIDSDKNDRQLDTDASIHAASDFKS